MASPESGFAERTSAYRRGARSEDPALGQWSPRATAHGPPPELSPDRLTAEHRLLRALNVLVASLALAILSPIILVVAIAIKLDSKGPVLYRQLRIGLDRRGLGPDGRPLPDPQGRRTLDLGGRPFTIYKFRTMRTDAEQGTGPVWAARDDDRTTKVGQFLRSYRFDEIPQFLNVLRGDMAVVGPRPERPSFVNYLRSEIDHYPLRHRVPPGITGWAQVNQEPDQEVEDVRAKLAYDLEYLQRRSLAFDLRIMLKTLPVMLARERSDGQDSGTAA